LFDILLLTILGNDFSRKVDRKYKITDSDEHNEGTVKRPTDKRTPLKRRATTRNSETESEKTKRRKH
jgi:hypothetical protein